MIKTIPVPVHELSLLQAATQGVMMPACAAAAVQAITAHLPCVALEAAINDLRERAETCPQDTPEQHLARILICVALLHSGKDKGRDLNLLALHATQWASVCDEGHSLYEDIAEEAKQNCVTSPPTFLDLAVLAGDVARKVKHGQNPRSVLIELAGQSLTLAIRESEVANCASSRLDNLRRFHLQWAHQHSRKESQP